MQKRRNGKKSDKKQRRPDDQGPNISIEQIEGTLKQAPERMDRERNQGLAQLTSVKRAKLVQARRERARMEQRYGADHPRVLAADARMKREHGMLVNTRAERDRAGAPLLEKEPDAWVVHGYVRSQEGEGISKARVALFPDRDGHKDALIETVTDRNGYYKLSWSPGARGDQTGSEKDTVEKHESESKNTQEEANAAGARINANRNAYRLRMKASAIKNPVYLGASHQGAQTVDARSLYPTPGSSSYRDIELNSENSDDCRLKTRYLGNSGTRELHDLRNEQPGCLIARIRPDHRVYFTGEKQAQALGYDYCAYCYGPDRSKR